jgi:hypothetical protein
LKPEPCLCPDCTTIRLNRNHADAKGMKLNAASLAIGAGIGVAIVAAAVALFLMQPGRIILDGEQDMAAFASNNGSHFFMSGIIKNISDDEMTIDQTFGNPEYLDNPNVKIRLDRGGVFVSCHGRDVPGESCKDSVVARMGEGVYVCAHTRMYNGEFYAGKIWADSGCGPIGLADDS